VRAGCFVLGAALVAAGAASAQIARPEKAHLEIESATSAGGTASLVARVEIDEGWHVQAHVPTYDYLIPTVLSLDLPPGSGEPEIDYPAPQLYKFAFADEQLDVYEGTIRITARFALPPGGSGALAGTAKLRYQACDDRSCLAPVDTSAAFTVTAGGGAEGTGPASRPAVKPTAPTAGPATGSGTPAQRSDRSLAAILLLALVGGFILNGMPCVLPILSLKLFGLVKAAGQERSTVRIGALATAGGILISFWGLAAAAIVARGAGAAIGWGVQFQQPGFVAFLALVILLFSLNLWGLFEIQLPTRLARFADSGASGEGLGGHFASGLFATLMATPCSAPFLGTALSFALGQSAGTIFATLTAVGVGLALPYLLLSVAPGAVRFLPRPGAWMDTLRGAMGFLLAGALVWLLYVLSSQVSKESLAIFELTLLAFALAVWLASRSARRGRALGGIAALLLAAAAIWMAARAPRAEAGASVGAVEGGIEWVAWDRVEAERLSGEGRLVFLDITADWCVTCKVNERVILNTPEVVAAFRSHRVVAMKADWTNRNDEIARFLADHGRYGIPFYMLFRPGAGPHVFGELITKQEVIDVIAAADGA